MPFVPETGVGLSNANAYVDVAFADAHHLDRGNAGWTGSATVKEQAIVRATDYVDKRFGRKFRGFRQGKAQALEWPRIDAFDDDDFLFSDVDVIPRQLKKAVAEYALRALLLKPLAPDPALPFQDRDTIGTGSTQSSGSGAGAIVASRQKVGPIETETKNSESTSSSIHTSKGSSQVEGWMIPAYPEADLLIEELLRSSQSRRLVRG